MIGNTPLERRVAAYLSAEATARAPESTLASILSDVATTDQRRSPGARAVRRWASTTTSRRTLLLVAAALLIVGSVVVGALLLQRPRPIDGSPVVVLIETPPGTPGDPTVPVSVVSIGADGRRTLLATLTSDKLGGAYSEWWAALSPDGHLALPVSVGPLSQASVVDLRAPRDPAVLPDAEGTFPAFGPDGRLAFATNAGPYAVFDPLTGSTTFMGVSGVASPIQTPFTPVWSAAGDGLIVQGSAVGLDRLDGTFAPGMVPGYYGGTGPRRIDASGRYLDCPNCGGDPVVLTATSTGGRSEMVWNDDDPAFDIADFAWASDGNVWMLLESVAPGPRQEVLVKLVGGHLQHVVTFTSAPDDPDPGSYTAGASIAAMAPDDARIVIHLVPGSGAHDELWMVDPARQSMSRLPDGIVAGWLQPTTLTATRPTATRLHELDPALRGVWSDGSRSITIRRTTFLAGTLSFRADAQDGQTIAVDGDPGQGATCPIATSGRYRWTLSGDTLELSPVDDACAERTAVLAGTYRRALPYPDTGPAPMAAGQTFLVPDPSLSYTIATPAGLDSAVTDHRSGIATVSLSAAHGASVTIFRADTGVEDPCARDSSLVALGSTVDDVAAYLKGLGPSVVVHETDPIRIDARTVRSFDIVATTCQVYGLFATSSERNGRVGLYGTSRVHLIDLGRAGVMVAISSVFDTPTPETRRWIEDTLASIRFDAAR